MERVFHTTNGRLERINHALELGCTVKQMRTDRGNDTTNLYVVLELSSEYIEEEQRAAEERM